MTLAPGTDNFGRRLPGAMHPQHMLDLQLCTVYKHVACADMCMEGPLWAYKSEESTFTSGRLLMPVTCMDMLLLAVVDPLQHMLTMWKPLGLYVWKWKVPIQTCMDL